MFVVVSSVCHWHLASEYGFPMYWQWNLRFMLPANKCFLSTSSTQVAFANLGYPKTCLLVNQLELGQHRNRPEQVLNAFVGRLLADEAD